MKLARGDFYEDYEEDRRSNWHAFSFILGRVLYGVWRVCAFALYIVLGIFEWLIPPLLMVLANLIAITAFIFRYGSGLEHFPFWTFLAVSAGCMVVVVIYYELMRLCRPR